MPKPQQPELRSFMEKRLKRAPFAHVYYKR